MNAPRPLQNRVDPFGELWAVPERGRLMGNRGGRIHDAARAIGRKRWASKAWIACLCEFRGRWREVFGAGYTELFFRDEPTALAAGHRPCFQCRYAEAKAFQAAFPGLAPSARAMDARLHAERLAPKRPLALDGAPDGAMVLWRAAPHLVAGGRLHRWSFGDYGAPEPAPAGAEAIALTPPSILAALKGGYKPRGDGAPQA
ncbi:MAG: hypothetical protein KGM15_06105 [Pseudomonadota bacterium]|nr:hypothetical protein [Pseudomonadota bacterium]